jgi:hypothetical protein
MGRNLKFGAMLRKLEAVVGAVPEHREGKNTRYEILDAVLAAFSVYFTQAPSFLAHQRDMERRKGQNNARSLFGVQNIPSDGQTRNLLDPVDPTWFGGAFWDIFDCLGEGGQLDGFRGIGKTRLISIDGSQYFSSGRIHCDHCRSTVREDRELFSHQVLLAVVCGPDMKHVICLEPEFLRPQDGHEKQDCEQQAFKRWIERHGDRFAPWSVTVLADDLHSHQPVCEILLAHKLHFLMTCKPESHEALYEEVGLLEKVKGGISVHTERRWTGEYHERWTYRWVEEVPLRAGSDALKVQWCECTIVKEETGEPIYHNAWVTDHPVDENTIAEVVASGRCRWKVENEGFNVLKNLGYNFEHNFGHGSRNLSAVLLTLLLLAFLFHTVLDLGSLTYRGVRHALGVRRTFFNDLRALTRYLYFPSWENLIEFMYRQLELGPLPDANGA